MFFTLLPADFGKCSVKRCGTSRLRLCAVMSNLSTLATKCCRLIRLVVKSNAIGPTERDGKCLPNQPTASPCRMFLSRSIGQINPAELEAFHLAYWVIDAGYSALASGFGSYPSRSNGWHSSSKKNISVRRTLSLPAINKANMLSVSYCWMEWFIHTTPLISLFPWEPLRNSINSTFCINISNKANSPKVGSQVKWY